VGFTGKKKRRTAKKQFCASNRSDNILIYPSIRLGFWGIGRKPIMGSLGPIICGE